MYHDTQLFEDCEDFCNLEIKATTYFVKSLKVAKPQVAIYERFCWFVIDG